MPQGKKDVAKRTSEISMSNGNSLLPNDGFNKRFSRGCEEGFCVHIGTKSLIKCEAFLLGLVLSQVVVGC